MFRAENFAALIRELQGELEHCRQAPAEATATPGASPEGGWPQRVLDVARRRVQSPHEVLDWVKRDRHWSFTLAEVMREAWTGPSDLAARVLLAIVRELEEERETTSPDALALPEQERAAAEIAAGTTA